MDEINSKIDAKQAKILKLQEKLERVTKALESGKNPYCYSGYDIKSTQKEINYELKKLKELQEKKRIDESIEHIPVIEEFLNLWKEKSIQWYKGNYVELKKFLTKYNKKKEEYIKWRLENNLGYSAINERTKEKEKELGIDKETYAQTVRLKFDMLTFKLVEYGSGWEKKLEEEIEKEKKAKRKLFLERVKKITGEIIDAGNLSIGENGEINGYVIGKKGKAKVETISAGGYNIQCYHFRVLVREIK